MKYFTQEILKDNLGETNNQDRAQELLISFLARLENLYQMLIKYNSKMVIKNMYLIIQMIEDTTNFDSKSMWLKRYNYHNIKKIVQESINKNYFNGEK